MYIASYTGLTENQKRKMESFKRYYLWTRLLETKKNCPSRHKDGEYFDQSQWRPKIICDIRFWIGCLGGRKQPSF